MKKVLITGVNSYVGNKFAEWIAQYPDDYEIDKISLKNNEWKKMSFSDYDTVLHVSAIVHQKEDNNNRDIYYRINSDLTYCIAKKAKNDGVKQFIYFSTMSVYGLDRGIISQHTPKKPKNHYGASKLQAENRVRTLEDEEISIAILRPPMIYGKGAKGNYQKLARMAKVAPIFPNINNSRSMLHIDNLSEFLRLLIDNEESGVFFPQNKEYVNTSEMVHTISRIHRKRILMSKLFNPFIHFTIGRINIITKVFGTLVYDKNISTYQINYRVREFEKSLIISEKER